MSVKDAAARTLLVGLGNILLTDDGVGVHVIRALETMKRVDDFGHAITLRDGGTIGMALLPEITGYDALVAIDAMELGEKPGTVRAFQGPDMDAQLRDRRRTVHEVALAELMAAARLTGRVPDRRALVAIQPGSTQWGLSPTEAVNAAIPKACETALSLIEEWRNAA